MRRQDILDLVSSLRRQADIIEACDDSQEFDEALAEIRASLDNVS